MPRLIVLLALLAAALAAPGFASASLYKDARNEQATAPDIATAEVFVGADGRVNVEVTGDRIPALTEAGLGVVGFDTDRNATTGAVRGADYLLLADFATPGDVEFDHWDGTAYVEAPRTQPIAVRFGAQKFGIAVHPAELGGVQTFNFFVAVASGDVTAATTDLLPDAGSVVFPSRMEGIAALFVPRAPKAGTAFRVSGATLKLTDEETVAPASIACAATLNGKKLKGAGKGGCTFRLPKAAKGKRLRIVITATYGGEKAAFDPYVFRVK